MKRRLLSWLLVLALCLSLLPAAAMAEDAPEQTGEPTIVEQTEEPAVQEQTKSVQAVNETAAQATCQITIRKLDTTTFTLNVELTDTVRSLKQMIQQETGTAMENQTLIFNSTTQLEDSKTLAYYGIKNGSTIHLKVSFSSHTAHPICGATHTDIGDHEGDCPDVTWTALTQSSDGELYIGGTTKVYHYTEGSTVAYNYYKLTAGSYYLGGNIAPDVPIRIEGSVHLCLNGYSITKTTNTPNTNEYSNGVITIIPGGSLSLCDCKGGGKITHAAGMKGQGVAGKSSSDPFTFTMFGGEISGNNAGRNVGGDGQYHQGVGVYIGNKGTFTMYGGAISNNHYDSTSNGGGGVYVCGPSFTMYGGEISYNTSSNTGGGVSSSSTTEIHGGTIKDNKAEKEGGGIITSKALVISDKAVITDNTAAEGGGIWTNNNLTISDEAAITGNAATNGNGGGVYYYGTSSSAMTVSGSAKIEQNTATQNGGGVYFISRGEAFNVSGDISITGNKAGTADGNVYLPDDKYITVTGALKNTIGVTTQTAPALDAPVKIAGGSALTEAMKANFTYEGAGEGQPVYENAAIYLKVLPHEHPICGDKTCTEGHDNATFRPLTEDQLTKASKDSYITSISSYYDLAAGSWYLKDDLTLTDGVLRIQGEVKLCLNGHTIQNSVNGYAIFINGENASLTLCDCSDAQSGTITTNFKGRGVAIWNGSFTMYGGSITGNGAKDSSREGYGGAGVYVPNSATFTMYGGTITGNNANTSNGGGVYVSGGGSTFNLYGGSITGNKSNSNGGGVYVFGGSTFNMSGDAVISNNTAKNGGAIYVDGSKATVTMTGGSITGNTATCDGGGVRLSKGTFNMSGSAAISRNTAGGYGGGVDVNNGTFNMSGGSITGNTTTNDSPNWSGGGGVFVYDDGKFTMSGGSITGNNSVSGAGVALSGSGTMTVSGSVQITGNWQNGALDSTSGLYEKGDRGNANNLYLFTDKTVTIGTAGLNADARIGVTTEDWPDPGRPVQIATGATNEQSYYTAIFTPDAEEADYKITKQNNALYLSAHEHTWTYTADDTAHTITAQCSECNWDGGSVTLRAPAGTLTYTGQNQFATYEGALSTGDTPIIYYQVGGNDFASGIIRDAGTYTAVLSVGGQSVSVDYTIKPAELTVTANPVTITYGETAVSNGVTYSGFVNGETEADLRGNLTYTFSYTPGGDKGLYIITPGGLTSGNYDITFTHGTLTVEQREVTLTWHDYEDRTYDDGKTVTATAGNLVNNDDVKVTVENGEQQTSGTYTATATALTGDKAGNYKLPQTNLTKEYTIGLAKQELTFEKNDILPSVTYGDTYVNPATNNRTDGGAVTYTSSKPDVATVDENGVVTAKSVGTTIITATAAEVPGKYRKATEGYTLAVTQRNVTLTVNAESRVYGEANPDFTAELTGGTYAPGDGFQSLDLTLTTEATVKSNVGSHDVTGTANNTNYKVTVLGEKKLTITQRPITVEVDAVSRTYGDRNPNFTANTVTSGSLVNGDMLVLTLTTDATETSPVGKYDVTLLSSDSPNYDVTVLGEKKLTVTPKPITVTVNEATRPYGEANPNFTATAQNGALVGDDTIASLNLTLSSDATTTSNVGKYDVTGTASNKNYTVTIDGTKKLTVTKKELTADDLEFADTPITKDYDGKLDATVTVQIKDSAKVKEGDVLPTVTGTGTYNSKDVKDANKVTFVTAETESSNYILPANLTKEHEASITKRVISIKSVTTAPKQYDRDNNAWSCITDVSFNNLVSGETLTKSKDYGITEATFNSADVELANTITGVVGIINPNLNYTFVDETTGEETSRASFTTSGKITKANGGTLDSVELTIRCTNRDEKTYTIDQSKLPSGQNWTFSTSAAATGKAALSTNQIDASTGVLTYQLSNGAAGDTVTWTVTITCGNYEDYTLTITLNLIALDKQENFEFENKTITKTYGDPDFTVAATGAETGSNVTYAGSNDSIAEVAADGTVTIKKVGTVTITATAGETKDYDAATATCTLVIEPAKLTVTALDKTITVHQSAPDLSTPVEGEDYKVEGLLGTDTLSGPAIMSYYKDGSAVAQPDTSQVGTYEIVILGLYNSNYSIRFVPGTLTIEASPSTPRLGIIDGTQTTPGGTVETSPKNALPGQTVTITVTPRKGYELGGLVVRDIHGDKIDLVRVSDNEYTFVMPDSSVSIDARFVGAGETGDALFRDVPANAYYYDAVAWAAENDITGGVGGGLFAPDGDCTRAQIVTFLWRAAGSPEPESKANFVDVPANAYYAKAVAWALENGITKGTSATTFSPDDPCTRAQAVTFLARALSAKAEGTADFIDVAETAYYAKAVAWASENGVTSGVGGKRFAPDQTCTRAQIVTFLYRAYNK